jgi:hypothetical protein
LTGDSHVNGLGRPGAYGAFYPQIHSSWIVMEFATIAAAATALLFPREGPRG